MTYLPIYQDLKHTFASSDSLVHYTIMDVNDNLLYEGSAYRKPGQEKAFIYINRIVSSNINIKDIAGPSLSWVNGYATFTAVVKEVALNNTVYRTTYRFVYNWDYELGAYTTSENINFPVTTVVSPNDTIPISYWVGDTVPQISAKYNFPDGTNSTVNLDNTGAITNDINTINIQASTYKAALISSDSVDIMVGDEIINTYRTNSCNRYTLYYY